MEESRYSSCIFFDDRHIRNQVTGVAKTSLWRKQNCIGMWPSAKSGPVLEGNCLEANF